MLVSGGKAAASAENAGKLHTRQHGSAPPWTLVHHRPDPLHISAKGHPAGKDREWFRVDD